MSYCKVLGHGGLLYLWESLERSLHRVTRPSQSSASNTNILQTVQAASIHTRKTARTAWETFSSGLYGSYPSSLEHACVDLFSISPRQQMSSLHSFQERCLRRCVQETVADAGFLCDRCAMEAWQLLSCSCFPSVLFLSPVWASCSGESGSVCSYITAAACWFMEHRSLRLDPGNTRITANAASFHLVSDPRLFACWTALCGGKTWHWAVTNR